MEPVFRGTLATSSWNGLSDTGAMPDASAMIRTAEHSGAWPVALNYEDVATSSGISAPGKAIVASYEAHPSACIGVVGGRYRATTPDEWRTLISAAVAAGARPVGAFSMRHGSRVLATFDITDASGICTRLLLADSFDKSFGLTCGTTSIRARCTNVLATVLHQEGTMRLRHTSSLEQKVNVLAESISDAARMGDKVRRAYERAEATRLSGEAAQKAFDLLFPRAPEGSPTATVTRLENYRTDAMRAAALPINNVGGTVATLWNASTYLVDRNADGSARQVRSGDRLDSILFGTRAKRIEQIQELIEVVMADGSHERMTVDRALECGVSHRAMAETFIMEAMA